MSETLTITLSEGCMNYLRKYSDSSPRLKWQPLEKAASDLLTMLLKDMEADERNHIVSLEKRGTIS